MNKLSSFFSHKRTFISALIFSLLFPNTFCFNEVLDATDYCIMIRADFCFISTFLDECCACVAWTCWDLYQIMIDRWMDGWIWWDIYINIIKYDFNALIKLTSTLNVVYINVRFDFHLPALLSALTSFTSHVSLSHDFIIVLLSLLWSVAHHWVEM